MDMPSSGQVQPLGLTGDSLGQGEGELKGAERDSVQPRCGTGVVGQEALPPRVPPSLGVQHPRELAGLTGASPRARQVPGTQGGGKRPPLVQATSWAVLRSGDLSGGHLTVPGFVSMVQPPLSGCQLGAHPRVRPTLGSHSPTVHPHWPEPATEC